MLALLTATLPLPTTDAAFTSQLDRLRWNVKVSLDVPGGDRASSSSGNSNGNGSEAPLVHSRRPHKLANGRGAFLGFRNAKDVPGYQAASRHKTSRTKLQSTLDPLMPDGGLSPCVIRVLGVGGGGCNAVRSSIPSVVVGWSVGWLLLLPCLQRAGSEGHPVFL
jgi:hypothetical protein